jgi:hypothetical protein
MTTTSAELESRLGRFVEHHVLHGERLAVQDLCADRRDLEEPLRALIDQYLSITTSLDSSEGTPAAATSPGASTLPSFDGFQTIERIGAGGMGEVFKLRDLRLDRIVAAKVLRSDRQGGLNRGINSSCTRPTCAFTDRRIVQIHECRRSRPAVIIMGSSTTDQTSRTVARVTTQRGSARDLRRPAPRALRHPASRLKP